MFSKVLVLRVFFFSCILCFMTTSAMIFGDCAFFVGHTTFTTYFLIVQVWTRMIFLEVKLSEPRQFFKLRFSFFSNTLSNKTQKYIKYFLSVQARCPDIGFNSFISLLSWHPVPHTQFNSIYLESV